jgi:large subunit ribosomal protein L18e
MGKTEKNSRLRARLRRLAKESRFWASVLRHLETSSRRARTVNVYHLNRVEAPGGMGLVVGKLLGVGSLKRPLKVVAFDFSDAAYRKILEVGGEAYYLEEYLDQGGGDKGFVIVG